MSDMIPYDKAREMLDISDKKLRQLIKDGLLTEHRNPLDGREKFVIRAEVEELIKRWKEAA
jgi:DNA-binding MarR family transcriptional regulator